MPQPVAPKIRIYGVAVDEILYVAKGLEAIATTHTPPDDVPPGSVARAAERIRRKAEELYRDLAATAEGWALDGAEGIEGVESLGEADDEREDWQQE